MLKLAFLLAVLLCAPLVSQPLPDAQCPATCPSTPQVGEQGGNPADVSFLCEFRSHTSGTGSETCATCTQCTAEIFLAFGGGNGTYCMVYSTATSEGGPVAQYARGGTLRTNCNDYPDYLIASVVPCRSPTTYLWTFLLELLCGCQN